MLRAYKFNGKTWRFEEGEQPEGAVLVEMAAKQSPEERASKAPAKRRASKKEA